MKPIKYCGKAITIREPWASAIAYAGKNIENRDWRTHYRGPIAIHAGADVDFDELDVPCRQIRGGPKKPLAQWIRQGINKHWTGKDELVTPSNFVAIAMIVDCVERSSSPWFEGEWGWVLEGIVPIEPVPWKGALSFWDCEFKYKPV